MKSPLTERMLFCEEEKMTALQEGKIQMCNSPIEENKDADVKEVSGYLFYLSKLIPFHQVCYLSVCYLPRNH